MEEFNLGYNSTNNGTLIQSGIYLSKTIESNTLTGLALRQDYTPFQLVGYSSINSIDRTDILDLSSQTENYVLNNGINVGSGYSSYQLNAYYYDTNNNKVSINDYILSGVYPTTDYYWGKNYRYVIPAEYLQNIPNNTVFYYELIGNHTEYSGTAQDQTQPPFNLNAGEMYFFETTSLAPSPTPTPTGTPTPSGDSSGDIPPSYPTPIDYNNRFDNIDNSLSGISGELGNISGFLDSPISTSSNDFSNAFDTSDVEDVEDPTDDFFAWFFNNIRSCFEVNSNQVLSFSILGNNFQINSDDYILNIPILTTVIGYGSGIFIFYCIFCDIRKEIEKVKEGKFADVANDDISANMM